MVTHHRVWFKVIFNPILRKFGYSIVSKFKDDKLVGYSLKRYPENCQIVKTKEVAIQTD